MNRFARKILKDLTPPLVLRLCQNMVAHSGFYGNYSTWGDAKKAATGYDSPIILERVKESLLKVKQGLALCERDSVLFDKMQYSWPLLAGLLWIASQNRDRLNLVDFGGSLGSSYFQNRKFFNHLEEFTWNVVEQSNFAECGKLYFEDKSLKFYDSLDECASTQGSDTIVLSSVLQYLPEPYGIFEKISTLGFRYVLIDRTPFLTRDDDRITVQKVPEWIYPASYPAWFFNLERFKRYLSSSYEIVADFESFDRANIPSVFMGFILKKREHVGR
jgi:putative methyltransferase (TIGR04325 family)